MEFEYFYAYSYVSLESTAHHELIKYRRRVFGKRAERGRKKSKCKFPFKGLS